MSERLMIYGAYGYSGELIAREAVAAGLEPILAGRRPEPLDALGVELDCETRPFQLDTSQIVERRLADVKVLLHCAGPFSTTFRPMVEGCLAAGAHYLDITGEIDVLESLTRRDRAARDAGVAVVPAVGFDVAPSDCLIGRVKNELPDATRLVLGIDAGNQMSRGTNRTMIEQLGKPSLVRRDGKLTEVKALDHTRRIDFGDGEVSCIAVPWGDLATAYRSTGIGDIEAYMQVAGGQRFGLRMTSLLGPLFRSRPMQWWMKGRVAAGGPNEERRNTARSRVWARVENDAGGAVEGRLEGPEAYAWTARLAVRAAQRLMEQPPVERDEETGEVTSGLVGFQTPASAFGVDFIQDDDVQITVDPAGETA